MKSIYLDNAATTPVDPRVLDAQRPWLEERHGNPSSRHRLGVRAAEALDAARAHVARATGADPRRVLFTSGGTEANNLAVLGLARAASGRGKHVVVGPVEHSSVRDSAAALRDEGFEVEAMRLDAGGDLDLEHATSLLREDTVLVAQMVASNEFGTIFPLRELARRVRARAPHALVHADGVQALGKLDVDLTELGCDSLSVSAHKIHAPKGTGALVLARELPLRPLCFGGGQEGALRPGTQDVAGIVAFGEAVRIADDELDAAHERLRGLRDALAAGLRELPGVRVLEPGARRLPNLLSVLIPGVPAEVRLHHLDARGVMASAGSACSASSKQVNPALLALGLDLDEARSVLRFSVGRFTTPEEIADAVVVAREVAAELAALSS